MSALSSSFQTFMLLFFLPRGMRPRQCLHRLGNTEGALSATLHTLLNSLNLAFFSHIPKGAVRTEQGYFHGQQLPSACWQPGL